MKMRKRMLNNTADAANQLFASVYKDALIDIHSIFKGQLSAEQKLATMKDIFIEHDRKQFKNSLIVAIMFMVATEGKAKSGDIPDQSMQMLNLIFEEGDEFIEHLVEITESITRDGNYLDELQKVFYEDKRVEIFMSKVFTVNK